MSFPFENLEIYKHSLDFVEGVSKLLLTTKGKVSRSLVDQLTRASLSIPLNIAEGAGRWHLKEKLQFLRISQGSTFECVAIIQVLSRQGVVKNDVYLSMYDQLQSIAKMNSGFIKSLEKRASK